MRFNGGLGYLIHDLAQRITSESDKILFEKFGIGFSQYKVLIAVNEKQGVQQKHIAHTLAQTEASISRQIGLLIDSNMVEIGPASDNRQHLIYLTSKGERLVQNANKTLNNHHAPFFEGLSEAQLSGLSEKLQFIRNKLG